MNAIVGVMAMAFMEIKIPHFVSPGGFVYLIGVSYSRFLVVNYIILYNLLS